MRKKKKKAEKIKKSKKREREERKNASHVEPTKTKPFTLFTMMLKNQNKSTVREKESKKIVKKK